MQVSKCKTAARVPFVYRHVSFERAAFDKLKEYQRKLQAAEGRTVTNGEALSRLILSSPLP